MIYLNSLAEYAQLHEYHHQRPLHIVGVFVALMGLLALVFSVTLHDILLELNSSSFSLLNITRGDLDELHAHNQYYLVTCIIFSGLVVDLVGPRTIIVLGIAASIAANYFFIKENSNSILLSCREVINFSHIFVMMGALTLGTHWLPRRHFSLYVGFLVSLLIIIPIIIHSAIQNIVTGESLKEAFAFINATGILVILGLLLTKRFMDKTRYIHTVKGLLEPFTYYKVWLIGLVAMIGWLCNTLSLTFGALYILKHFNLNPDGASSIIHVAFICFGVGAVFMGFFSDFLDARRYLLAVGYFLAALSFSVLIFTPTLSYAMASTLLFSTAFFMSSLIICYRKANDYCTIGNSGLVMGFVFSVSVVGAILFSRMLGHALEAYFNAGISTSIIGWQVAPAIVPMLLFLGAGIAAIFLRVTHSKVAKFLPIFKSYTEK